MSLLCSLLTLPAAATVTLTNSGLSSVGTPISFRADLTITGNMLTIVLSNASPVSSLAPNDTLGSFFFDILSPSHTRPTLTLSSAFGNVYVGDKNHTDPLLTANANLNAVSSGFGWVFRGDLNATLNPFYGFGLGAVGDNSLSPNNFNGNLVGGSDYTIVRGDVTTQNLNGTDLVRDTATFTFTGLSGWNEGEIVRGGSFGLGTAPDSVLVAHLAPEPGSAALLGLALAGLCSFRRRSRGQ